jgi:hypothetical protein
MNDTALSCPRPEDEDYSAKVLCKILAACTINLTRSGRQGQSLCHNLRETKKHHVSGQFHVQGFTNILSQFN